jgi:hypothetical protein
MKDDLFLMLGEFVSIPLFVEKGVVEAEAVVELALQKVLDRKGTCPYYTTCPYCTVFFFYSACSYCTDCSHFSVISY